MLTLDRYGESVVVRKTYHREFRASEEVSAYDQVRPLMAGIQGLRAAEVLGVDDESNTVLVEHIDGVDLREKVRRSGIEPLELARCRIIELLARAREKQVRFDADPANFIAVGDGRQLVLIDPPIRATAAPDFAFVVFAFGVTKAFLANPFRCSPIDVIKLLRRYYRSYCARIGGASSAASINRQVASYVDQVIRWNSERLSAETATMWLVRLVAGNTVLKLVKAGFALASVF